MIQEYGYVSLIFRHISVEGLINDIAIRYIGEKEFYSSIEMMRYVEKIEYVYKQISKVDFPKDRKIYSNIKDLNSVRNTLVHMKSATISYEEILSSLQQAEEKYYSIINSMMGNKKEKKSRQKDYIQVLEETELLYDELGQMFYNQISIA